MLSHYDLMIEMEERRREMERKAHPDSGARRRRFNHSYLKITGYRYVRSPAKKLAPAGIDLR
mgnify:CR=1 FL=1